MSQGTHMPLHPAFPIDGKPVLGSYVVDTVEMLEQARNIGINMVMGGHEELDPSTPKGRFCQENGIKIAHHMTRFIYHGVRLGDEITAEQTEIPLVLKAAAPSLESHVIALDDELIRYDEVADGRLVGCERGWGGTTAAWHREDTILFWPEECAREVDEVKDSPNLYGWYVLDDSPGDARSALRAMYRTIREHDTDMSHPVCAGYGDAGSVLNFGPGICDVMVIYWYPAEPTRYMRESTSEEVQWILAKARERVPGVPFMGIFQSFDGTEAGTGQGVPTGDQLREQLEDFVREGASGLIAFLGHHDTLPGWADIPDLGQAVSEAYSEILETGGLVVRPETPRMAERRTQPTGHWSTPNHVPGYVPAWRVAAPFPVPNERRLAATFPPDEGVDLDAVYVGPDGPIRWRTWETTGGVMELSNLFGHAADATGYAVCDVTNPSERKAIMRVSTDNDSLVCIDGVEVYRFEEEEGVQRDKYAVEVTLPVGTFRLFVKCHNRTGGWGFFLRFADTDGAPLEGLTFDPERI